MKFWISLGAILFAISFSVNSAETPKYKSNYIGQEKRLIKSLSEDDIQQLKHGKGWGLAKAAELNGMPGPSHILQMKEKISLTKEQEAKVRALFEDMKSKAIPLGNKLIHLEKTLNDSFANRTITNELLNQQLDSISKALRELRYVHLVTHLMTPNILTPHQIEEYNRLRGYKSGDPCKNIPEGHDAAMWKKHNDCK
jgi:Spy/CpxP family protein refolding chaperone